MQWHYIDNDFQQDSTLQANFRTSVNFSNCVNCFINCL